MTNRKRIENEMREESEAWTRLFFGVIPRNALQFVFDETAKNYTGSYAPNAFDVLQMWRSMETQMNEAKRRAEEKDAFVRRVANCTNGADHINDDGDIVLAHPCNPMNEEYTVPCGYCRPDAYHEVRRRTIAAWYEKHANAAPDPLKTLIDRANNVVKEFPR